MESTEPDVSGIAALGNALHAQMSQIIHGKPEVLNNVLIVLFAGGHVLVEDVPGVGKTLLAKTLARCVGMEQRRIQFTPDLLPSDVTGSNVFDVAENCLRFNRGPIFSNIVLADEVNRASPKTQSALLEAMEEGMSTVDGITHPLPHPFMVIGTSNPVDMEGTFRLPEAQRDRFMMHISMGYPDALSERDVLARQTAPRAAVRKNGGEQLGKVQPLSTAEDIAEAIETVENVYMDMVLMEYVIKLAASTRENSVVRLGVSPRGCVHAVRASKARAALLGRNYVQPDDIRAVLPTVWGHRILVNSIGFSGDTISGIDIVEQALGSVPIPVPL